MLAWTLPVLVGTLPVLVGTLPVLAWTLPVLVWTLPVLVWTLPLLVGTLPVLVWTLPVLMWTFPVLMWTFPVLVWTFPVLAPVIFPLQIYTSNSTLPSLENRQKLRSALLTYRTVKELVPTYLHELTHPKITLVTYIHHTLTFNWSI